MKYGRSIVLACNLRYVDYSTTDLTDRAPTRRHRLRREKPSEEWKSGSDTTDEMEPSRTIAASYPIPLVLVSRANPSNVRYNVQVYSHENEVN